MIVTASWLNLPTKLSTQIGLLRKPTKADLEVADRAQASVDFPVLLPKALPPGYSLIRTHAVEYARDLLIMTFAGPWRKSFRLTERKATIPLATELAGARVPHEPIRFENQDFILIGGEFVGEPVDLWHWHATRRGICWEQDTVICEIGTVIAEAPSLRQCLRVAASLRPLDQFRPSLPLRSAKGVDVSP